MEKYSGCIIEESLVSKDVLNLFTITKTEISIVTESHATPWLEKWTLHMVEIDETNINATVEQLKDSLSKDENWYADLKNDDYHYIIFNDRIFKVDRSNENQYEAVKAHGLSQRIPEHQLPNKSWAKRQ